MIACKLVNYLRYSFRFISAYLVIAFTIQRLNAVYNPLKARTEIKRTAWISVCLISLISLVFNIFTLFAFQLKLNSNNKNHCDVKAEFELEYLLFSFVYTFLVVVVPSFTIFACNCLIIRNHKKNNSIRKSLTIQSHSKTAIENEYLKKKRSTPIAENLVNTQLKTHSKTHSLACSQTMINRAQQKYQHHSSKKLTLSLLLLSFSFVLFNLPYLVIWLVFFYKLEILQTDLDSLNDLFAALQFSETFSLLHYGMKFFFLWATGSLFRSAFQGLRLCYFSIQKFFKLIYSVVYLSI